MCPSDKMIKTCRADEQIGYKLTFYSSLSNALSWAISTLKSLINFAGFTLKCTEKALEESKTHSWGGLACDKVIAINLRFRLVLMKLCAYFEFNPFDQAMLSERSRVSRCIRTRKERALMSAEKNLPESEFRLHIVTSAAFIRSKTTRKQLDTHKPAMSPHFCHSEEFCIDLLTVIGARALGREGCSTFVIARLEVLSSTTLAFPHENETFRFRSLLWA